MMAKEKIKQEKQMLKKKIINTNSSNINNNVNSNANNNNNQSIY